MVTPIQNYDSNIQGINEVDGGLAPNLGDNERQSVNNFDGGESILQRVVVGSRDLRQDYTAAAFTGEFKNVLFDGGDVRGEVADFIATGNYRGLKKFFKRGVQTEETLVLVSED